MTTKTTTEPRYPDIAWAWEDFKLRVRNAAYMGWVPRTAWAAGAEWVLARQLEWGTLTEREAIEELRKGEASVFYPLFHADPRVVLDCPLNGRVSVGPEGFCDSCGYDWSN